MNIDDPRIKKNIWELANALVKAGDRALVRDFLYCLLTPAEIADIAARWALVKALKRKIPQREIAKDLGISLCKITRGSRELKKPDSAFMRIFSLQEKANAR
jgi:TrpR family trp operon transcriptional repressor